jgi:hypothetical protein
MSAGKGQRVQPGDNAKHHARRIKYQGDLLNKTTYWSCNDVRTYASCYRGFWTFYARPGGNALKRFPY